MLLLTTTTYVFWRNKKKILFDWRKCLIWRYFTAISTHTYLVNYSSLWKSANLKDITFDIKYLSCFNVNGHTWKFLSQFCRGRQFFQTAIASMVFEPFKIWELLLKERICSLWEQILSFKSSSQWENKGKYFHVRVIALEGVPTAHKWALRSKKKSLLCSGTNCSTLGYISMQS